MQALLKATAAKTNSCFREEKKALGGFCCCFEDQQLKTEVRIVGLIWVIEQLVLRIWMRDNHVRNLIEAGRSLTVLGQGEGPASGEAEEDGAES